jgi:hypothetical protein
LRPKKERQSSMPPAEQLGCGDWLHPRVRRFFGRGFRFSGKSGAAPDEPLWTIPTA